MYANASKEITLIRWVNTPLKKIDHRLTRFWFARNKSVSSISGWTSAYGIVVYNVAISLEAARSGARIDAAFVMAG